MLLTRSSSSYRKAVATLTVAMSFAAHASAQGGMALTYDDGNGNVLPYRLFLPPGINDPGASFPLVVHLHGAGERGTNNTSQLAYINGLINTTQSEHPAILVVPQAMPNTRWDNYGSSEFSLPMRLTVDVLNQIEQLYPVDTSRRLITGLSLGAFGTWDLIGRLPGHFAAAMPLSAGGLPALAESYAETRIWAHHGGGDTVVPVGPTRETIQAIRDIGGMPLYSEVQGGHGIWQPIYDDPTGENYDWFFDNLQPELATWQYDPTTGSIKLDANAAPGGSIFSFRYAVNQLDLLNVPAQVLLDGVAIDTNQFFSFNDNRTLIYSDPNRVGFTGVLELPGLLPTGLGFVELMGLSSQHFYFSPETGTNRRFFNILVGTEIPEPASLVSLGLLGGVLGIGSRRR
ncbi:carboxylesterase family protein [Botrimarina hoheduenensis]|nr:PEP-CTERM sorting domain-containing protein [Botrimarina hoheduenensis]